MFLMYVNSFKMSEDQSENILLKESSKWKKIEEYVLSTISNYKNDCKREEELNKTLINKIEYLKKSNSDLIEEIKSEGNNKYFSTHDLFKLGELSDQINDSCNDIEKLLEICKKLQDKYKSNLEKLKNKLLNRKKLNEEKLKSQSNDMMNIKKNIRNCNEELIEENKKNMLEMYNLKKLQEETEANLKLFLENNQHLEQESIIHESEIKDLANEKNETNYALNKRNQLKESTLVAKSDLAIKINEEIKILNEKKSTILKKYEDTNINIEEWKISIVNQENMNEDLVKENIELRFETKSQLKKLTKLKQYISEEEKNYLQNYKDLKDYVQSFSNNIHNKNEILLKEKETENTYFCDTEKLKNNLKGKINSVKNLQENFDKLYINKNNLLECINNEEQSIKVVSKIYEKNHDYIKNLKTDLHQLNTAISSLQLEYENNAVKLMKNMENLKAKIETKNKELEAAELKYHVETDKTRSEGIMNFNMEIQKLESDLDDMKKINENKNEEIKQLSINLESKTLEYDILVRKIKTAEGVQSSLKEEFKPKPIVNKLILHKKRHVDESSESSFDGNILFHQRMLLKKKMKRSKTPTKL